jgi:hypothetical protein
VDGLAITCEGSLALKIRHPLLAVCNIGESCEAKAAVDLRHANIKDMIFDAILKKVMDSLSGMLIGSDLITTDALLAVHKFGDKKGKVEDTPSKAEMFKKIKVAFMEEAGSRLLLEWGVKVRHLIVTEIRMRDPEVQRAMADGVRRNVEAAGMLESARIAVETAGC